MIFQFILEVYYTDKNKNKMNSLSSSFRVFLIAEKPPDI